AVAFENLAVAQFHIRAYRQALQSSAESLALHQKYQMPTWKTYNIMAASDVEMNDVNGAVKSYEGALSDIEQVRGELSDPASRRSFFDSTLPVYDNYLAYLSELDRIFPGAGWDRKAFRVFERRQG